MRLHDRAQAATLLAPVIARRCTGPITIVGIGAGGATVAAGVAATLGGPWGWMDIEPVEVGDALHPPALLGAVAAGGRVVLLTEAMDRLPASPGRGRATLDRARAALDARREDRPAPAPLDLRAGTLGGATVVVVDDGTSPAGLVRAAVDLVRMAGAERVTVAVACAPAEQLELLGRWAGDVCTGWIPPWTEWYGWGGRLYDEDLIGTAPPPAGDLTAARAGI